MRDDSTPAVPTEPSPEFPVVELHGVTELRVHGVSGTPVEAMLRHPHPVQVSGDRQAGCYRRGDDHRDYLTPTDTPRRHLEAYSWGRLTAGASTRALWLILLPFMLVNVAAWAHPRRSRDRFAPVGWMSGLLRLLALSLTGTLLLATCSVAMDVIAWQCAGNESGCGSKHFFTAFLDRGWFDTPGRHIAVAALVPVLVLCSLWWLSRDTSQRYERFAEGGDGSPAGHDREASDIWSARGLRDFSSRAFWFGGRPLARLRSLHVAASLAGLASLITYASAQRDSSVWAGAGHAIHVAGLVVAGLAAMLVASPLAGRRRELLEHRKPPAGFDFAMRRAYLVGTTLVVLALVYALWLTDRPYGTGELPGLASAIRVLLWIQLAVLAALLLATVWAKLSNRGRDASSLTEETHHSRRMFWGFAPMVFALFAVALAGAYSAGLAFRVADYLGYPATFLCADECEPTRLRGPPIRLPPEYVWAAQAFTAALVGAVVALLVLAIAKSVLNRKIRSSVEAEYATGGRLDSRRVDAIASAQASARLTDSADALVLLLLFLALVGTGALVIADQADPSASWLSVVTTPGTWLAGAFVLGLVAIGRAAYHNEQTRRTVGIIWDLGTFWPRSAHPFAPPCYAERAVPEVVTRIRQIEGGQGSVVLSAHSQGTVIAVAVLAQLTPAERSATALLTYGSPLERLYARSFPHFFSLSALDELCTKLDGRWINLYRRTDPIGGPIFVPDGDVPAMSHGHDQRLTDPEFAMERWALDYPIPRAHSDYFHDRRFVEAVDDLVQSLGVSTD